MLATPPPPVLVHPTQEIRTVAPVAELVVDAGRAATLVGESQSWEYALVWSPTRGVIVRSPLLCDTQESNVALAGDVLAHVCFQGGANTVVTATLRHPQGAPRLKTSAFVSLAGGGSVIAGSAGRTLWRFDAGGRKKLRTYRQTILVFGADRGRILVGYGRRALDIVSTPGQVLRTLQVPRSGGAVLRGNRIATVWKRRVVLTDLRGQQVASRPVAADAQVLDVEGDLVTYAVETRLHLLRLRDGRDVALRLRGQFGYATARLWHGGLFYSYSVQTGRRGRLGYVSPTAVRALLRR